jgi:AraC family transcriptional regulator of arabinose operon
VKRLRLQILRDRNRKSFRLHLLGLHEPMPAGIVNRPQGTGDYLFMLFHSPVRLRSGGRERDWPASTMMVWTPQDGHFYGQADHGWDHSWFHCGGQAIARIVQQSRLPVGRPFAVTDPSLLERYLLDTVEELNGWSGSDEITLRNLFENYVRAQARQVFDRPRQLTPARLLAVRAEVEDRYAEKLRLPELAQLAGWSVPHLCAEFRRFFGVPVQRYAQQLRLNQAAYLLRDRNRRIGEIALQVGYPDLYTFSKMFKRAFGISPRSFRQKNS